MDAAHQFAICLRDRFTCRLCGEDLHDAAPAYLVVDRVRHGEADLEFLACRLCVRRRGGRPLEAVAAPERVAALVQAATRPLRRHRALARALMKTGPDDEGGRDARSG